MVFDIFASFQWRCTHRSNIMDSGNHSLKLVAVLFELVKFALIHLFFVTSHGSEYLSILNLMVHLRVKNCFVTLLLHHLFRLFLVQLLLERHLFLESLFLHEQSLMFI